MEDRYFNSTLDGTIERSYGKLEFQHTRAVPLHGWLFISPRQLFSTACFIWQIQQGWLILHCVTPTEDWAWLLTCLPVAAEQGNGELVPPPLGMLNRVKEGPHSHRSSHVLTGMSGQKNVRIQNWGGQEILRSSEHAASVFSPLLLHSLVLLGRHKSHHPNRQVGSSDSRPLGLEGYLALTGFQNLHIC